MSLRSAVVLGLALGGCQTAPADRVVEIAVRGDGEGLTLVRGPAGCRANEVDIAVHDGEAHGGGWHLTAAPAGRTLALGDATVARLAEDPGPPRLIAYLDPIGVPLARLTITDDAVTVSGPDRAPIGRVETAEGELRWVAPDGHISTHITGTADLAIAAALVAPSSVPLLGRAVVACSRLVATSSPAK